MLFYEAPNSTATSRIANRDAVLEAEGETVPSIKRKTIQSGEEDRQSPRVPHADLEPSTLLVSSFLSSASAPKGTSSPTTTTPQRRPWRLRLLLPTLDIDVGIADYATLAPRLLSLEYLFYLVSCACVLPYGFAAIKRFCDHHSQTYINDVLLPSPVFLSMGAVGFDNVLDKQWTGYLVQLPKFLVIAACLGAWSTTCRYLQTTTSTRLLRPFAMQRSGASTSTLRSVSALRRLRASLLYFLLKVLQPFRHPSILPLSYAFSGLIFIAVVHGPHFFLPLLLILANYVAFTRLQRWCSYRVFMAIMWITHITFLYIIERCKGFENTYVLQYYFPTSEEVSRAVLGYALQPLWGIRLRWYVAFRMTTLRLIAFNYDLWEATHCAAQARERAADRHDTACVECAQLREQNSSSSSTSSTASVPAEASRCYKYRTECARDAADYSLVNYLAYVVFPPLYLAGPMSSFNAFVSHMRVPSTAMPPAHMLRYALRILRIFATEYVLLHYVHIAALATYPALILQMSVLEQAHFLLYSLAYTWLKFSFIWKSSRLFAMFSGIEVPEDMQRCFANTLTIRDFWRDWHASFNLWIVRYMYIPMGGRPRVALSVLPIFLFIALWHDPALHLIKWALCIAAMFVVELAVSAGFSAVSAVFSREMAATTATGDEEKEGAAAAADDDTPHTPQRSRHGGVAAVVRPAARFAARHMSPRVRAWCHRMLRVVAGMSTVVGLIVANLIGFAMHNATATFAKTGPTAQPADAENVMGTALRRLTPWFAAGMVFSMFVASSLAVLDRDVAAARLAWLRRTHGLKGG